MTNDPADEIPLRPLASAALLTTIGVLPVFLVGALAPFVAADLGFAEAELGVTVASYFAASAVTSIVVGRAVERIGARRAGVVAAVAAALLLVASGVASDSWLSLSGLLAAAGIANATGQLAANLSIARQVPARRRGLAYGVKQSAVPAASLIGGLCVPVVALTVGWRWAFVAGALLLPAWLLAAPPSPARIAHSSRSVLRVLRPSLLVLALSAAMGAGAANAMAAFFLSSAVSASIDAGVAGGLLAVAGASGVASRIALGWYADRAGRPSLRLVSGLMALGAAGLLLVAGGSVGGIVVGIVLGYAAGWGWNGLLTFAVAAANADAPAVATGVTQAGVYVGGIVGPLLFGVLAQTQSYQAGWLATAALLAAAAGLAFAASLGSIGAADRETAEALSLERSS